MSFKRSAVRRASCPKTPVRSSKACSFVPRRESCTLATWSRDAFEKRNYGHATVELAMKIGENIKNLSASFAHGIKLKCI